VLEVSVAGEIDPVSGYVVDLGHVARVVEREFVDHVDHKNLNLDVEFMRGVNPTSENIVVQCWRVIEPHIAPARLKRLRLWETENNYVEYEGQ
jgi:6-pyruvoyltetrahydropterin/6-carboxytetrahydropterin synthase